MGNNWSAQVAATALKTHGHKYSPEKRAKIRARIRTKAATVNLAGADGTTDFGTNGPTGGQQQKKAQKGKTRAQPRAFGGRFGKKGKTSGEQAMPGSNQPMEPPPPDPNTFIATANNLQIGQSVALPNNMAKVKRLGRGYQLYKVDGSLNTVVKTLPEVHDWIKKEVAEVNKKGDSSKPAA